jgi:hypothetical protein
MADRVEGPRVLLKEAITFALGDGQTHAPMVHARVGDAETRLILDTGSDTHLLITELADRLGLEAKPGEAGTDSTGASVPSWTLGEVGVRIGSMDLTLQEVVAIAGPEVFVSGGIGGILSPQRLHPTAWAVLDLVDSALFLLEGSQADVAAWLTAHSPSLHALTLEREAGDATILVRAAVEPHEPVVTLLDTGGKGTEAAVGAVPGLMGGATRSTGRGVGGGESFGSEVADQVLLVGDARVAVPRLILRDAMAVAQVLVGMDVLRGTVLAVSRDLRRPVIWLVPR